MKTNSPFYSHRPIGSVAALSRSLGYSRQQLKRLAAEAPKLYPRARSCPYEPGSLKVTYNPAPTLKALQRQLVAAVFDHLIFPTYVTGGIKGRSYKDDCLLHVGASWVVKLDIGAFYESVNQHEVAKVWQHFFAFAPDVTELLTRLTTHKGHLPRGAPSSSHLANLIFWDTESTLEAKLAERGIRYSRYVDDVTLSSAKMKPYATVSWAVAQVYGMFARKGVSPNRAKQNVMYHNTGVRVHNINVGGSLPHIPRKRRDEIRAEVHAWCANVRVQGLSDENLGRLPRIRGLIAYVMHFHPDLGKALAEKLSASLTAAAFLA